jgi:hypothetical protein
MLCFSRSTVTGGPLSQRVYDLVFQVPNDQLTSHDIMLSLPLAAGKPQLKQACRRC